MKGFTYALLAAIIVVAAGVLAMYLWWYTQASGEFWSDLFAHIGNTPQQPCPTGLIPEAC